MNPYWINEPADQNEWLESERIKKNFYALVGSHILLWALALVGMVAMLVQAQKAPPILAFTAKGEAASGTPISLDSPKAGKMMEEFLDHHIQDVTEHMFMRTEKGSLPALSNFVNADALAKFERAFSFTNSSTSGYIQTLSFEEFTPIRSGSRRRIYQGKGVLSNHSLKGSANTPLYLVVVADKKAPSYENPHGWLVSIVISVTADDYTTAERNALIEKATKAHRELELEQSSLNTQ